MPVKHREFLEYLESISCVRQFIVENLELRKIVLNTSASKDSDKNGEKNGKNNKSGDGKDDKNVIKNPDNVELSKEDKVRAKNIIIFIIIVLIITIITSAFIII